MYEILTNALIPQKRILNIREIITKDKKQIRRYEGIFTGWRSVF